MFTNIEITQFRSCAGVNISDLRGITALAGRNGSGKTNTLRAIRWLAAMATGGDDSRGIGTVEGHREVSATIQLADTTFRYHVQHVSTQNGPELMESLVSDQIKVERNGEQVILDFHDEPLQIDLDAPCIPAIISLLLTFPRSIISPKRGRSFPPFITTHWMNHIIQSQIHGE
jgi:hypothetical protein